MPHSQAPCELTDRHGGAGPLRSEAGRVLKRRRGISGSTELELLGGKIEPGFGQVRSAHDGLEIGRRSRVTPDVGCG